MTCNERNSLLIDNLMLMLIFVIGMILSPFNVLYRLYNQVAALFRFIKMRRMAKNYKGEKLTAKFIDAQLKEISKRDCNYLVDTFFIALMFFAGIWGTVSVIGTGLENRAVIKQEIAVLTEELNRPEKSVWSEMFSADLGYAKERLPQAEFEGLCSFFALIFRFYCVFSIGGFCFTVLEEAGYAIRFDDPLSKSVDDEDQAIPTDYYEDDELNDDD